MPARHATHGQLRELAAFVVTTHLSIVVLDIVGRASYDGGNVVGLLADHRAWMALHVAAAVLLVLAITLRRLEWAATFLSSMVLGGWSLLELGWRAQAPTPVPLLGPVLGLLLAGLAAWLAHTWTE